MSKFVLCLMGPTASGKTALACELAQRFPLDIISVDSAMIYRGMDIGTAKPDAATLLKAPHRLMDILDPPATYSAAQFCTDAREACESVIRQGRIPFLVGGTMMYFRALQQGLSELPQANEALRAELLQQAKTFGWEHMHGLLTHVDAESAARIHPNDAQRIQRALEVYRLTQRPLSAFLQDTDKPSDYQFINLALLPEDRAVLHQRIAQRFEDMLAQGLIDEVKALVKTWELTPMHTSMRSVGYRQVLGYLQGEYNRTDLYDKGVAATRQLAKRQLTWLRHWPDAHRFESMYPENELTRVVEAMLKR